MLVSHIQQPDLHEPELARCANVLGAVLALLIGFLWAREAPRERPARGAALGDMLLALVLEKSGEAAGRRAHRLRRQACWRPTMPRRHWNGCSRTLAPRQQGRHGGNLLNAMRR